MTIIRLLTLLFKAFSRGDACYVVLTSLYAAVLLIKKSNMTNKAFHFIVCLYLNNILTFTKKHPAISPTLWRPRTRLAEEHHIRHISPTWWCWFLNSRAMYCTCFGVILHLKHQCFFLHGHNKVSLNLSLYLQVFTFEVKKIHHFKLWVDAWRDSHEIITTRLPICTFELLKINCIQLLDTDKLYMKTCKLNVFLLIL